MTIAAIISFLIAAEPVIELAVELLIIPALVYYLKTNRDKTQNEKLLAAVDIAVGAAEQIAKRDKIALSTAKHFKYATVIQIVKKEFPNIDEQLLDLLIESAVNKMTIPKTENKDSIR